LITHIRKWLCRADRGAATVEYGLMTLIAVLVGGVIVLLAQVSADGVTETCESVALAAMEDQAACSNTTGSGDRDDALPAPAP
jgi:Flp pilus assembly pilin Flp